MRIAVLASSLTLALTSLAGASPRQPANLTMRPVCADGHCKAFVATDPDGKIHTSDTPQGFGADDIQSAYNVDATLGSGTVVGIVEGTGYDAIETDLAAYRAQYGLPPCSIASGCLTVINDDGQTSPLPAGGSNETLLEAALDIDMVSAACPSCKLVVIEGGGVGGEALELGQEAAAHYGVDAISTSYGGVEDGTEETMHEGNYDNPGIGQFVSSGDDGYTGTTPDYPSTSAHVISVGGTHLAKVDPSVNPRGWVETAWSQAGSSCSTNIPKQDWAPAQATCGMRAASDISAVADPATGLAVYVTGQWTVIGGTSASAPIAAGVFAGGGHAHASPAFVYKHSTIFNDVSQGQNGSCTTTMCIAGAGWDGPTGLGSLDQGKLAALVPMAGNGPDVSITYPTDNDAVQNSFTIQATAGSDAEYITIAVDDTRVASLDTLPFMITAPATLADGAHTITVTAFDIDGDSKSDMINITQGSGTTGGGDDGGGGGCAAGGDANGGTGALLVLGLGLGAVTIRRRRAA
jgi:MYXO-CTERM domain-containing protein